MTILRSFYLIAIVVNTILIILLLILVRKAWKR